MNDFEEYEQDEIDYIADKIIEYKYNKTERKFNKKLEQGFYNPENTLDMINFLPEAFFTEFKKFDNEDEIYAMLSAVDLVGDNGFLYTEDGGRAKADKVLIKTIDPDICQEMTERYIRKTFGDYHAIRFKTNFENQKEIAFEAFAHYFAQKKTTPDFEIIKDLTSEELSQSINLTLTDTKSRVSFIRNNENKRENLRFGDTTTMAIARITDTEANNITKSASFGTLAPFKHYIKFDKYKEKVLSRIEILPEVAMAIINREIENTDKYVENEKKRMTSHFKNR